MRFPLKVQLVDSLAEFGRTRSLVLAGLLTAAAVVIRGRVYIYYL